MVQRISSLLFVVLVASAIAGPLSVYEVVFQTKLGPMVLNPHPTGDHDKLIPVPPPTTQAPKDHPCFKHLHTGKAKTVVRLYDPKNSSELIDQKQPAIWSEVKTYFSDFYSIDFVELDVSACPNALEEFPQKKLPAYGMIHGNSLLGLCNAPDTYEKMKNFFFDYAYKSYKKEKGFETFSSDLCEITYPNIKGLLVFQDDHDEKVKLKPSFVLYLAPLCRYCKQFIGLWNTAYEEYKDSINFYYIDCMAAKEFCASKRAFGYPTLFYYPTLNSSVEYRGNESDAELRKFLSDNLNNPQIAESN